MTHKTSPIVLIVLLFGCNTFGEPDPFVTSDTLADAAMDSGDSDAGNLDAQASDTGDMSEEMGIDQGTPDPRFRISAPNVISFAEAHELDTSVAVLSDGQDGHLVSLAYRHDPNFSGNDAFVASAAVFQTTFGADLRDTFSGNESFDSVAVIRDSTNDDEFVLSVAFDNVCTSSNFVVNSLHMYGTPGSTGTVSGNRDCTPSGQAIDVMGSVELFQAADGSLRYALLTTSGDNTFMSTSHPFNSNFDYVEVLFSEEVNTTSQLLAAPGLLAVYEPTTRSLVLWSGLSGENPPVTTANPATKTSFELGRDLKQWVLSGALPTRYEAWGVGEMTLEVVPLPCSVAGPPTGHINCTESRAGDSKSLVFDGPIVDVDATRAGELALAAVLVANGQDHALQLVVYDGTRLEAIEVAPDLGDLLGYEISIDAFRVNEDRRIVAIAKTSPSIETPGENETEVYTFELLPFTTPP